MSDLSKYADAVRQLSREGFMRHFNHPFLLVKTEEQPVAGGVAAMAQRTKDPHETFDPHRTSITHILPKTGSFAVLRHNAVNYRVYAVVPAKAQVRPEDAEADPYLVEVSLGRAQDNDIVLDKTAVSKHHAVIVYRVSPTLPPTQAQLRDVGSRNGTFLKGKRVPPQTEVDADFGDAIVLGDVALSLIGAGALWEIIRAQAGG